MGLPAAFPCLLYIAAMTYRHDPAKPIHVTANELGQPLVFSYLNFRHKVERVIERYRVDTGWWDQRVWCEVFRVITRDGMLVDIYRDLAGGGWYLLTLYD